MSWRDCWVEKGRFSRKIELLGKIDFLEGFFV